ncbi:hypothetical protein HG530_010565 [Fusarium avenaceum]|nr:hypothetical protein HG530_010565 [Fusarium avenaceum]
MAARSFSSGTVDHVIDSLVVASILGTEKTLGITKEIGCISSHDAIRNQATSVLNNVLGLGVHNGLQHFAGFADVLWLLCGLQLLQSIEGLLPIATANSLAERTEKPADSRTEGIIDTVDNITQGPSLLKLLIGSVEDTASEILDVHTREAIGLSGISTEAQKLGVLGGVRENVDEEVGDGVIIINRTLVPVLGNALPALVDLEVTGFAALDTKKGGENLAGEDSSEGREEEVAVGLYRVVVLFAVEGCQRLVLLGSRGVGLDGAPVLFEAALDHVVVVSSHVEICASGARVRFVLVVAATKARGSTKDTASTNDVLAGLARATDGVARVKGERVTVDNGTVNGQKAAEVKAHAVDLVGGLDNGLQVCDSVVGKIAMVGQGIETGARTSLVTQFEVGGLPLVLTRDADALLLGIKLDSSLLLLSKGAITLCVALLALSSEGACFRFIKFMVGPRS